MKACLLVLFMIVVIPTYAHTAGNISGKVIDAKNGIPLVGVYVQIKNSLIATTTDLDGNYELKNIQIGTYELAFSFIGYKTVLLKVEGKENVTDTLNISY